MENKLRDLRGLIPRNDYDQGGWCPDEKRDFIHSLIQKTNSKFCVEIGVYRGSSILCFAEVLEKIEGKIVGIDPWSFEMSKNDIADKSYEDYIYNQLLKGQETFDQFFSDIHNIIYENNLTNTVSLIRSPSEDSFLKFEMESIDVLHIDGNHNEMNVSRDILLYLPLVKKGGYVIMDDSNWVGVRNSINNFLLRDCNLVEDFGSFSYYKKS